MNTMKTRVVSKPGSALCACTSPLRSRPEQTRNAREIAIWPPISHDRAERKRSETLDVSSLNDAIRSDREIFSAGDRPNSNPVTVDSANVKAKIRPSGANEATNGRSLPYMTLTSVPTPSQSSRLLWDGVG